MQENATSIVKPINLRTPIRGSSGSNGESQMSCSGERTRTPNNWTRTSCVADYTTPEWAPQTNPSLPSRAEFSPGEAQALTSLQ